MSTALWNGMASEPKTGWDLEDEMAEQQAFGIKVRLETKDGLLVGRTTVLPFNEPPAVLLWGDRVFGLFFAAKPEDLPKAEDVYREVFAVAVINPVS